MDAALAFGGGYALNAMDSAFEFELSIGLVAGNTKNNFFVASGVIDALGLEFEFKVVGFGVSLIHAKKFGSK